MLVTLVRKETPPYHRVFLLLGKLKTGISWRSEVVAFGVNTMEGEFRSNAALVVSHAVSLKDCGTNKYGNGKKLA